MEGQLPLCALALAPRLPPREILMVIKCSLVTMHIPNCDLSNVNFARQERLFVFPNIKFAASVERQKAKCFSFKGASPPLTP